MRCTVRNAKESYNELHQVKALVLVPDSAAHAISILKITSFKTNFIFQQIETR